MAKKLLIGLGVFLALALLALVAVATLVDANRYKPQIESLVKEKTGRTLKLEGDISLSVLPRIAINLPKTTLSNLTGERTSLSVNSARVSAAWLPLLRGRLQVGRVTADGLNVMLERRADGSTNLDDLIEPKSPAPPTPDTPAKASVPPQFEIGGVSLTNADITIDDRMGGSVIHLTQMNLHTGKLATRSSSPVELDVTYTLTAPEARGHLKLHGVLDFDWVGRVFGAQRLEAQLSGEMNKTPQNITLEVARLSLRPATEGTAVAAEELDLRIKGPLADLQFDSGRLVARKLDIDPVLLDFSVLGLEADAQGQRGSDAFEVKARISKLLASREEATGSALDVSVRLSGGPKSEGAKADGQKAGLQSVEGRVQMDGLSGRAQALNVSKLSLAARTTLEDATGHPRHIYAQFAGAVRADLNAYTLTVPSLSGEFGIDDARLPNKGFKLPMDLSLKLDLKKESLLSTLKIKFDEAPAAADLEVKGLLSQGAARQILLQVKAGHLNLDRYIVWSTPPAASDKAATKSATQRPAPAADIPVDWSGLRDLNLHAEFNAEHMQVHGVKAANVQLVVKAADGRLDMRPLTAGLYGGSLNAVATATATNTLAVRASMVGVAVGPLLKDGLGEDLLAGRGSVKIDLTTSGATANTMRRAIEGSASFGVRDGALNGINLGKALREARAALGSGQGGATSMPSHPEEKTDFAEISGTFDIAQGIATNKDLQGKSPLLRLSGEGKIDLVAAQLDYTARVSVVNTTEGQDGRERTDLQGLTAPVRITGPLEAPTYKIDWGSTVRSAVTTKASEEIKEKLAPQREELKAKLKNLLNR